VRSFFKRIVNRIDPAIRGFASAAAGVLGAAVGGLIAGRFVGVREAPPEFLHDLTQIGVGLLIAYSVAIATAEKRVSKIKGDHEFWVGFVTAVGCCGFLGVSIAAVDAALVENGIGWFADEVIWWWSIASIGLLGWLVAVLPLLTYEWRRAAARD
jgi:hypothetical protein